MSGMTACESVAGTGFEDVNLRMVSTKDIH